MINIKFVLSKLILKIQISSIKNSSISKKAKICARCYILNSNIDKYSYIGYNTNIFDCDIGKFCSIAEDCFFGAAEHNYNFVSTSPVFYKGKNILKINFQEFPTNEAKRTKIDNDVWIGTGVYIKQGVHIGTGAIIGMGSVVTKDIPPYEIWAGNPAHLIKKRFDDETIARLLETHWWEKDDESLKIFSSYFDKPNEFLEFYKGEINK